MHASLPKTNNSDGRPHVVFRDPNSLSNPLWSEIYHRVPPASQRRSGLDRDRPARTVTERRGATVRVIPVEIREVPIRACAIVEVEVKSFYLPRNHTTELVQDRGEQVCKRVEDKKAGNQRGVRGLLK